MSWLLLLAINGSWVITGLINSIQVFSERRSPNKPVNVQISNF
ncbi:MULTISPECIES: hypothetical protein [Pseudanabaena]|nr:MULTISPECIES: hypothetical protein [Pseudanabaena]MEA5486694.1 hypothetical protein [Pseudanabaena sp. CCNP1317]WGS73517.1 hypothetical protein OA858_05670 [Pseudanabaena galeata CCNP1313]